MERISRASVDERIKNLNRRMEHHGSSVRYVVQARNGYLGIDRQVVGSQMVDRVMCGTKPEVADFLHAGMVVLDDLELHRETRSG